MKRFILPALLLAALPAFAADKPLTKADVEAIVKETIAKNPEVIVDALNNYRDKMKKDAEAKRAGAVKDKGKEIFEDKDAPVVGNPKGDVAVAEFFDYHCGYCKRTAPAIAKLVKEDKNVKVVMHELPILSADSLLAAKAATAAYRVAPAKYMDYHMALMAMSGQYTEQNLLAEAKKLGIDEAKLKKEMEGEAVKNYLERTSKLAEAIGAQGTPFFVIGDQTFPGALSEEELKKAVAEARKKK